MPPVSTSDVSERTLQRRKQESRQHREVVSGGDSDTLLQMEVRSLGKEDKARLLQEAGITIDIPPEQGLAMKADLSITWSKFRTIRR